MAEPALRRLSYADYLKLEASTGLKHEYLAGEVFGMAGGSAAHADLALRLAAYLLTHLEDGPCLPSNSDLKIRVPERDFASYPDIAVVCGERVFDAVDPHAVTNPTLLVEVLSPSTEAYDRGDKFDFYQSIPTLRQYLLVSSTSRRIEVYTRNPDATWTVRRHGPGDTVALESIGVSVPVDAVYRRVTLDPRSRGSP